MQMHHPGYWDVPDRSRSRRAPRSWRRAHTEPWAGPGPPPLPPSPTRPAPPWAGRARCPGWRPAAVAAAWWGGRRRVTSLLRAPGARQSWCWPHCPETRTERAWARGGAEGASGGAGWRWTGSGVSPAPHPGGRPAPVGAPGQPARAATAPRCSAGLAGPRAYCCCCLISWCARQALMCHWHTQLVG